MPLRANRLMGFFRGFIFGVSHNKLDAFGTAGCTGLLPLLAGFSPG
jgi:hypothetical protein